MGSPFPECVRGMPGKVVKCRFEEEVVKSANGGVLLTRYMLYIVTEVYPDDEFTIQMATQTMEASEAVPATTVVHQ